VKIDSYDSAGIRVAAALVNLLTAGLRGGRPFVVDNSLSALNRLLDDDPSSRRRAQQSDCNAFARLANELRNVFEHLDRGEVDAAACGLNALLDRYPANPHLEKEDGIWRVHHHPANTDLCSMWAATCAGAMARQIGDQNAHRFGVCNAFSCDRVFVDTSRNGSRRFCSTSCQNRTKTAAFRRRISGQ
jgi:predicted RNA-binding Zn ribbon-like protein